LHGIVSVRTVALFLAQGVSGCVPWSMINTFFNDYLAQDKGLGVKQSTSMLILFAVGGMLGTIWAGWYGQILFNNKPENVSIFMGSSAIVGVFPVAYLVLANYDNSASDIAIKSILSFISGGIASCVGVNIRALLLNVLHPMNRGTAFSLFMLTDDLGKGFGPLVVAGFVAAFGRETAFFISVLFWIPCGCLLAASCYTLKRDLQTAAARYQTERAEENRSVRLD
jgi:MFS-type transporter involved in bile tolerance (Atg22 family)